MGGISVSVFSWIKSINQFLWSGPLLFLLMVSHLYFTMKLHFPQKNIWKAIRLSLLPSGNGKQQNLSAFATLSATLAATLGTGNIVGVSTAIALGGPGAIFWCWITGILGMATSYAECFLSVRFRSMGPDGSYQGGPMYLWQNGLHKPLTGKFYGFLTLLAAFLVGCTTQSNSIVQTTTLTFGFHPHVVGILAAVLSGMVIVGGIRSIGSVCQRLVPVLAILYIGACLVLLFLNREAFFPAIRLILADALLPRSVLGGAVGSSLIQTARYGIARGLFTNEAGIGTAAITAAASEATEPSYQAYVSMTAVFWDTVVMCLLSGLVIVTNMILRPASLSGVGTAGLTDAAFSALPYGNLFLSLCLCAFAITTLIGWSYLGEQAYCYVTGNRFLFCYKVAYIVMIYLGAVMPLNLVWECTDLINALMVLPNLAALFLLKRHLSCNFPKRPV